jgi:hypothetical protein
LHGVVENLGYNEGLNIQESETLLKKFWSTDNIEDASRREEPR